MKKISKAQAKRLIKAEALLMKAAALIEWTSKELYSKNNSEDVKNFQEHVDEFAAQIYKVVNDNQKLLQKCDQICSPLDLGKEEIVIPTITEILAHAATVGEDE